jgi:tetratricopeptide (TPR) repeat protein
MKYRGTLDKILSDLVFEEEPSDSSFADFVVPEISLRQEIDNSLVEIVSDIMSQLHRSKSFEIWKVLQALCLRNDWAYGHNLMGKYYRDLSEFSKASSHFDQAIALRPEFDDALFERSMLHIRDREFDAAVLLLQIARRNDPYRAAIRARLGQAFLGLKKPAEAISQLERAVALAENWDLPRKLLSEAYLLLN